MQSYSKKNIFVFQSDLKSVRDTAFVKNVHADIAGLPFDKSADALTFTQRMHRDNN